MTPVKGFYICGTDTDIGKTYAACSLVHYFRQQGLQTAVMKPVASGCTAGRNDDALQLIAASGLKLPYTSVNPYPLTTATAPHLAAEIDGCTIDPGIIEEAFSVLARQAEIVIVEGVGGIAVPLSHDSLQTDLIRRLQLPVILVVGIRLGCINHALLSAAYLEAQGIDICGWIANQISPSWPQQQANIDALSTWIKKPLLGTIGYEQGFFENTVSLLEWLALRQQEHP